MKRIVLIGGYGAVGREAAALLTRWYPGSVVVAGRNPRALPGTSALRLDLDDPADLGRALDGADVVVLCVDHDNAAVARACFERGIHYVDVSADHERLLAVERLHDLAVEHGASGVLSVGLAPGITNLLARQVTGHEVRIGVLLGSGEAHGPAALAWTLDGLAGMGRPWRMPFPAPYGRRKVYGFPFSDQYSLPRTSEAVDVRTGMCLDSRAMTAVLAAARLPGLARLLAAAPVRRALLALLGRVHLGSDGFAVTARSAYDSASFTGRRQSRTTGVVAALAVRELASLPPGVRHLDACVDPAPFLTEAARWDGTGAAHYDQSDVT
ncbi:saccharopine dehydrogenase NADP-binding domain-containing protein [Streptomyces sp. TRM66268-LWL]|uniref:Saccharopine dehydrogenase NADP-binding domain-containing protein n=1 Tax=Streptomyces polyasparticus TaxID=2767826 RepID=A0ABR7SAM3_9ACTN|nr:saccharopine dehydrogenase NADP-binding domain-containing protein [Streptomyces polyasparticus]